MSDALTARKAAENDMTAILNWTDERIALLFHFLVMAGWTRDKAKAVLQKAHWWL